MKTIIRILTIIFVGVFLLISSTENLFTDLNDGLVAYYPFNGDAKDYSGNGNDGISNNVKFIDSNFGNLGKCAFFKGSLLKSYIDIGNNDILKMSDAVSITLWFRLENFPKGYSTLISEHAPNEGEVGGGKMFRFKSNQLQFSIKGVYGWGTAIYAYYNMKERDLKKWNFVVGLFDGNYVKIYFNGKLVGRRNYNGKIEINPNHLYIGKSGYGEFWDGYIDELRIYNRALSELEIKLLYEQGIKSLKSSLITTSHKKFSSEKISNIKLPEKCVYPEPRNYFIGIVVYDYQNKEYLPDLEFVKKDAELIRKIAKCYFGVIDKNLKIINNPTFATMKITIEKFINQIHKKDALIYFYYSGHGVTDSSGEFYLLPVDASLENEKFLKFTGYNLKKLIKDFEKVNGRKIIMIDACRTIARWKPAMIKTNRVDLFKNIAIIYGTEKGKAGIASKNTSSFTYALYEIANRGLMNLDFDESGYIEIEEIIKPLKNIMKRLSSGTQIPEIKGNKKIPLFPVE